MRSGVHICWFRLWFTGHQSMQIRLDSCDTGAQAGGVYLQVFHNALNIIPRLSQWDAFHPIDRVNFRIAWVPVLGHPFADATAAGVVARESHDVRAGVFLEQTTNLGSTHLRVVNGIRDKAFPIIIDTEPFGGIASCLWGN